MAKYTEHYQLHQWEPEDPFLRTDFNEDLNKVDQALSQLASEKYGEDKKAYVCGSYIGDGGTGMQDIALSFQPTLLYLYNCDPDDNQYTSVFTVGTQEVQCAFERSGGIWLRDGVFYTTPSGFQINGGAFAKGNGFNTEGITYRYIAFR